MCHYTYLRPGGTRRGGWRPSPRYGTHGLYTDIHIYIYKSTYVLFEDAYVYK